MRAVLPVSGAGAVGLATALATVKPRNAIVKRAKEVMFFILRFASNEIGRKIRYDLLAEPARQKGKTSQPETKHESSAATLRNDTICESTGSTETEQGNDQKDERGYVLHIRSCIGKPDNASLEA
jgi:hypothetical protein